MISYVLPALGISSVAVGTFFSGAATIAGSMIGQNITADANYSVGEVILSSIIGGILSVASYKIMNNIPVSNLNVGRGSWASVTSQIYTKFRKGFITKITAFTLGKMFVSEAYSGIAGAVIEELLNKLKRRRIIRRRKWSY